MYDELRRVARSQLRHENAGHTLSATALTHEAWFRLAEQTRTQWRNRGHFLAVASTMMRRILVNHAEARRADKRQAEVAHLSLSGLEIDEIGEVLGISPATVKRDWTLARAWLPRDLSGKPAPAG